MEFYLSIISLFLILVTSVTSNPIPEPKPLSPGACKVVDDIVDVLKLFKATPFCSTFLSLTPVTTTLTKTASPVVVITSTQTQTQIPTVISSILETNTLVNTVVQTIISTIDLTSTIVTSTITSVTLETITTSTSTLTDLTTTTDVVVVTTTATPGPTTVYTLTPARRDVELEERAFPIPSFLKAFASSAISDACSCLSLPTLTNSATITVTSPVTAVTPVTATVTYPVTSDVTVFATVTTPVTTSITVPSTSVTILDVNAGTTVISIIDTVLVTAVTSVQQLSTTKTHTTTVPASTVTLPYPNQVVRNPSFETGSSFSNSEYWTGFDIGDPFSFTIDQCDDTLCAYDGGYFVDFEGDSPGGSTSISQTLVGVQVGREYTFSAYVGFYNYGIESLGLGSSVQVTVGGVTVVAEQAVCTSFAACQLKGSSSYGYRQITGTVTPTVPNPVLTITMTLVVPTEQQICDTLLDDVTLTVV